MARNESDTTSGRGVAGSRVPGPGFLQIGHVFCFETLIGNFMGLLGWAIGQPWAARTPLVEITTEVRVLCSKQRAADRIGAERRRGTCHARRDAESEGRR